MVSGPDSSCGAAWRGAEVLVEDGEEELKNSFPYKARKAGEPSLATMGLARVAALPQSQHVFLVNGTGHSWLQVHFA